MKKIKNKIVYDEATLNFRVSKMLKDEIASLASKRNTTMSKYLRELLESVHDGSFGMPIKESNKMKAFLFSADFLKLLSWILGKQGNDKVSEDLINLKEYLKTIKKVGEYLPEHISKEFDKVLFDLLRIVNSNNYKYERFYFSDSYNKDELLNYELLVDFFTTSKLDFHLEVSN